MRLLVAFIATLVIAATPTAGAQQPSGAPPSGTIKGSAWQHDAASAAQAIARAAVVLPARATGSAIYAGSWADAPTAKH